MTPAMKKALDAIRDLTVDGVSPTLVELGEAIGMSSKGGVHRVLSQLEREGRIIRDKRSARSIRIVEGPTREAMERWSDEEIARVHGIAYDILATRCRREAVSA